MRFAQNLEAVLGETPRKEVYHRVLYSAVRIKPNCFLERKR